MCGSDLDFQMNILRRRLREKRRRRVFYFRIVYIIVSVSRRRRQRVFDNSYLLLYVRGASPKKLFSYFGRVRLVNINYRRQPAGRTRPRDESKRERESD